MVQQDVDCQTTLVVASSQIGRKNAQLSTCVDLRKVFSLHERGRDKAVWSADLHSCNLSAHEILGQIKIVRLQASAVGEDTGKFPQDWPASKFSIVDESRHMDLSRAEILGWCSLVVRGRVPHMPMNLVWCLVCDNTKRGTG